MTPDPGIQAVRSTVAYQFDVAWRLLDFHVADLTDAECLWRPADRGPHVFRDGSEWRAGWPETEAYQAGPPSIAWLTWHVGFWWSMVLDHSFREGTLRREDVRWPGSAAGVREWLDGLRREWADRVAELSDEAWSSAERTRWPFVEQPFHRLAGWLNLELMKNASEIGYCRFLYATAREAGAEGD